MIFYLYLTDAINHLVVLFLLSHIFRYARFVQGIMLSVNVISSEPFDKLRINSVRERIPGNLRLPW